MKYVTIRKEYQLENIKLRKVNHRESDICQMISFICI